MSENIKLNLKVYNKASYPKIINTDFTEFGIKPFAEEIQLQPSPNEFFNIYSEIFFDIPEFGETNSHQYLIERSSEYINYIANQDELTALQNEIYQLRTELLNTQKELIELQANQLT